ncbi:hypothetical protein T439DRAFT_326327 [Meredithblackwellia eburnea MCA 4105]
MRAPSHSRRSSSGSSHHGASGNFQPQPVHEDSSFDFANAFWSFSGKRSQTNTSPADEGREGYEALMNRMKVGSKTLEDLRSLFKERALMEEDHAKKLAKLSKSSVGAGETGHMERAIMQIKGELQGSSKAHADLADLLRKQDAQLGDFLAKRESARKDQQRAVEKLYKTKREQAEMVLKAKSKYETDTLDITGMNARAALSQGRELDKVTMKMEKIQQTIIVNERDYRNYVGVLKETTAQWNQAWRSYADLCQDQEEERLDFMKARMWDWANALSTVAVSEDEAAERSRTALEQCDPATDLKIFVQVAGTGNEIPDSLTFVDYKLNAGPTKMTYKVARFPRSSTRHAGMQHSPSAVDDIAKAFKPPPQQQQSPFPQQSIPQRQQQVQQQPNNPPERSRTNSQGRQGGNGGVNLPPLQTPSLHPSGRPHFAPDDHTPTKSPSTTGMSTLESALSSRSLYTDQGTSVSRPGIETSNSTSSMFSVSANASARSGLSERPSAAAPGSSPGKPGQFTASAFQRRGPPLGGDIDAGGSSSPAPAKYDGQSAPEPRMPDTRPIEDEDDDDPILRALNQLSTSEPPPQPSRNTRSPMSGSVPLPGMATSPSQIHASPSSDLRNANASQGYGRPSSRSNSPGPTATMMQPPRQSSEVPAVVGQYGQAFPGERTGSRPSSRQGSDVSRNSQHRNSQQGPSPSIPPSSSQPFAGVGARGRSPSPQLFNHQQWGQQPPGHMAQSPPQSFSSGPPAQQQLVAARPMSPLAFSAPPSRPAASGSSAGPYGQGQGGSASPAIAPGPPQQPFRQNSYGSTHTPQQSSQQGYPQQQQQFAASPAQASSPYQNGGSSQPAQRNGYHQSQRSGSYGVAQQTSASQIPQARSPSPQPHQTPGAPPPTGQYDSNGKPILFYVSTIYDYEAAGPDEFSFQAGCVIGVTDTDPDGWWQGTPVGMNTTGRIFPSNFTELLQ